MKKARLPLVLLLALALTTCGGCTYRGYSGDRADLYTVAIHSVLWNNGHSFSADRYTDPQIEIVDRDAYGRTLFTYREKYYNGGGVSFSALVVCQSSNETEAYYYEDVNYIVKEQAAYAQDVEPFGQDEIAQLKASNDWGQELDLDRCVKQRLTVRKPDVPFEKEIKSKITDEFQLADEEYALFLDFLTRDSERSAFILYGYIRKGDEEGVCFICLATEEGETLKEVHFLVPSDPYACRSEFIAFKQEHHWYS